MLTQLEQLVVLLVHSQIQQTWTVLFVTQGELDRERFSTDLRRTVERDTAYVADLRMFVSKGQTCFCAFGSAVKQCLL